MTGLFGCVGTEAQRGAKRRELTGGASQGTGEDTTVAELRQTVARLEQTTITMGQLTIIHDTRLRELETLIHTLQIPIKNTYAELLDKEDKTWKDKRKTMYAARSNGGTPDNIGSKHLQLGAVLLHTIHADPQTQAEIKQTMEVRWQGAATATSDFLIADVRICKWRVTRDGKHGILEFRLADDMMHIEKEIIRVLVHSGAAVKYGAGPKQTKVRELEETLKDTWGKKDGAAGSNGR